MDSELVENFEEVYTQEIEPRLNVLEKFRIQEKKKFDGYAFVSIVCWIFVFLIVLCLKVFPNLEFLNSKIFYAIEIGIFILLFLSAFLMGYTNNKFRKKAKKLFLEKILSIFGKFEILDKEVISLKKIKDFGLYHGASFKNDDDNISGEYKGNPTTLIETNLSHMEPRHKRLETAKDFGGLIIVLKFEKKFGGRTVVYDRHDCYAHSSGVSVYKEKFESSLDKKIRKKLEKVELEDVNFNKRYEIFSDNQVEARFILTPSFMEKIKQIKTAFGAEYASFVFDDGEFYLFLNNIYLNAKGNHGFFEVGNVMKKISNKYTFKDTFKELVEVFKFIDFVNGEGKTKS